MNKLRTTLAMLVGLLAVGAAAVTPVPAQAATATHTFTSCSSHKTYVWVGHPTITTCLKLRGHDTATGVNVTAMKVTAGDAGSCYHLEHPTAGDPGNHAFRKVTLSGAGKTVAVGPGDCGSKSVWRAVNFTVSHKDNVVLTAHYKVAVNDGADYTTQTATNYCRSDVVCWGN